MDRVSPFEELLDDDGEDQTELASGEGNAGVSHEFVQYHEQDLESFCWAPWRMLKIDIRARTTICCDFAHKLPKFEWPTAKTFHAETGMWNHPYMQHMRRTMGKEDELPFCTICRVTDKRDVKNAEPRRIAMRETQRIYRDMVEKIEAAKAKGMVDRYALKPKLFALQLTTRVDDAVLRPIVRQRSTLRNIARSRGFAECKRVLQIGALNGTMTPFLAEPVEQVHVVDTRTPVLERVGDIVEILQFDNVTTHHVESLATLEFEDGSFDGVWVDGRLLATVGRQAILSEVRRLLAIGGRVCVVNSLGPGGILELATRGALAVQDAEAAFKGGVPFNGRCSFVTSISVLTALKGTGLTSDRTCPPVGTRFPGDTGEPNLRTDYAEFAKYLLPQNRHAGFFGPTGPLQGIERTVTFTAIKLDPDASRHHH